MWINFIAGAMVVGGWVAGIILATIIVIWSHNHYGTAGAIIAVFILACVYGGIMGILFRE